MFILLEVPYIDVRRFAGDGLPRLNQPSWLVGTSPSLGYLRHFGDVRLRPRGGVEGFNSERAARQLYCEAGRGLRVAHYEFPGRLHIVLRRIYSDRPHMFRLEVGYRAVSKMGTDAPQTLVDALVKTHFKVRTTASGFTESTASSLGRDVARGILLATTPRPKINLISQAWIRPGMPLLIVELHPRLTEKLNEDSARLVTVHESLKVYHSWVRIRNVHFGVWWIQQEYDREPDLDLTRRLRLHLVRYHAEHTALLQIAESVENGFLQPGPETLAHSTLKTLVNALLEDLERPKTYGFETETVFRAVETFPEVASSESENARVQAALRSCAQFLRLDEKRLLATLSAPSTSGDNSPILIAEAGGSIRTGTIGGAPQPERQK